MDVGFCIGEADGDPTAQPIEQEKTNTVTTENVDPEIELRPIHAMSIEREPDERGQLVAAAFTANGRPMVLVLNTN